MHRLYDELADWWPLLSPPELFDEEAAQIRRWLGDGPLLELGSGAGLLASQLSGEVELLDLAPAMLEVSRSHNAGRVHHQADMRSARLGRTFSAVLLHDAAMYLLTEDDLLAAFHTAWDHLEPDGRLLVLPDFCAEDFQEHTAGGGGEDGERAIRLLEWHWAAQDGTVHVEMSALLREGQQVRSVHETHRMGLHPHATWWRLLQQVGFRPEPLPYDDLRPEGEAFRVVRPS